MQFSSYGITNQGTVRNANEDAFLINKAHQVFAFADGLGELILSINHILIKEGSEAYPLTGSGSTLTAAHLIGDRLLIGHVGDSTAYLLHGHGFSQVTIDHTMEQEFIERAGEIARKLMPPENPHTLTRCVGPKKPPRRSVAPCRHIRRPPSPLHQPS
ncbi:MAG: hypothetical protein HOO08_09620 [Opitutae bacterium]|jgi:serine/threonine protein phosphatase PrpC|nr:hypothetical protein [Opitutae bacterium]